MIDIFTREGFYQFILEREQIKIKKEKGDKYPWSDDDILSTEKFCNIDREDDRGTISIRESLWYNRDYTLSEQILLSLIYRFCVSSSTISDLIAYSYRGADEVIDNILKKDFKFSWNRSVPYHLPLISKKDRTNSNGEIADNLKWIVEKLRDNFSTIETYLKINEGISHEEATEELSYISKKFLTKKFRFYFAQGLLDVMYFSNYIDKQLPVHLGIGALKGLKRIDNSLLPRELMQDLKENIPREIAYVFSPTEIDYAILEHGMCEYTKYCEYALEERPRKNYFLLSHVD